MLAQHQPESYRPPYQGYAPPVPTTPPVVYSPAVGTLCPCVNDFKCDWWKYLVGALIGVGAGYALFYRKQPEEKKKE